MAKITRSIAEKRLADVVETKNFWCHDGRILKGLADLEGALREIDDATFEYHASGDRNDFAYWVGGVFGDDKLARDLGKSPTRERAARAVASRITWLRAKLDSE